MFKVDCPGCTAPYQVDERKVPARGLKMRCPKCGASFRVEAPGLPAPAAADEEPELPAAAPATPKPAPVAPPRPIPNRAKRGVGTSTLLGVSPQMLKGGSSSSQPQLPRSFDVGLPAAHDDLPTPQADFPAPQADFPATQADFPAPQADFPAARAASPPRPAAPRRADPDLPQRSDSLKNLADYGEFDLPTSTGARALDPKPDLPASFQARAGKGLGMLDLPDLGANEVPRRGVLELELPDLDPSAEAAPRSVSFDFEAPPDLQAPARSSGALPSQRDQADLDGFGDLELPALDSSPPPKLAAGKAASSKGGPNKPAPSRATPLGKARSTPESDAEELSSDLLESDPSELNQQRVKGEKPVARLAGGGAGYGEVNLDAGPGEELPFDATTDDDMEFGEIPQEDVTNPPAPRAAATAPVDTPVAAKERPTREKKTAPKRRRVGRFVALGVGVVALAGGALALLPDVGPFGALWIGDRLKADEYRALSEAVARDANSHLAKDVYPEATQASESVEAARAKAPRYYALDAYLAYVGYARELRFGVEPSVRARSQVILDALKDKDAVDMLTLARAAQDTALGNLVPARQALDALLARLPNAADVLLLKAELELRARDLPAALRSWQALQKVEPSARAAFGLARAQLMGKNADAALEAAEQVVKNFPEHAGAKLLVAELLRVRRGQEAKASALVDVLLTDPKRASPDELVLALVLQGDLLLARSRVSQAEAAYNSALQKNPRSARALCGLGEVFYSAGRFTESLARFEAASQADPEELAAELGVAKTKLALERTSEAMAQLTRLREAQPKSLPVAYWYGRGLEAEGKRKPAEQAYRAAIELGGTTQQTLSAIVSLAMLLNQQGLAQDAEQLLTDAKKKLEDSPAIYKALGEIALSRGRTAQALEAFNLAAKIDPTDTETRFRIAVTLRRDRQLDAATAAIEQVAALDADYPGLALERGLLHEASGRTEAALKEYEAALAKAPDDVDLMLRVGCTKVAAKRVAESIELLNKVLRQRPASAETHHCLGRALLVGATEPAAALRELEKAVELAPHRAEYWFYVGWGANDAGNAKRAEEALSKALELDQGLGDAYWQRGLLRARQGAVRDAIADLQKALELNPARYEAHAALADAFYDLGQEQLALAEWALALAADNGNATWHYRYGRLLLPNHQGEAAREHLQRALELSAKMQPEPRWSWEAHRLLASAIGQRPEAIPHLEAFLRTGPSDSPYRPEAKAMLQRMGRAWVGP